MIRGYTILVNQETGEQKLYVAKPHPEINNLIE